MNNSSYIYILFFPLALPKANDVDVKRFVALFFAFGVFCVIFGFVFFLVF